MLDRIMQSPQTTYSSFSSSGVSWQVR